MCGILVAVNDFFRRDDMPKKLKKKRQRLHLPVGASASSYSLQASKSVDDWLNISNKVMSCSDFKCRNFHAAYEQTFLPMSWLFKANVVAVTN